MGVDVASFGDFFAADRFERAAVAKEEAEAKALAAAGKAPVMRAPGQPRDTRNDPIKCLTYNDPFGSVYKKFIFSADGESARIGMWQDTRADQVMQASTSWAAS